MDLDNKCRTCLRIPKLPKHLFNDHTLLEKIQMIAAVEIENTSELPSQICEECYANINYCFNFRKVIINTEHDLQRRLETLKKTQYTVKPQSKIKQYVTETVKIKSELDVQNSVFFRNSDNNKEDNVELCTGDDNDDSHITRDPAAKELFGCDHCGQIFPSRLLLKDHKRVEHLEVLCNICGRSIRETSLKTHMQTHSNGEASICDVCQKTLKNSESLRKHKFMHSKHAFTCEICGKTFIWKSEYTRHIKRRHNVSSNATTIEKVFKCLDCKQIFASKLQLRKHRRTNHLTGVCNICGMTMRADNLLKHVKLHSEGPSTCDICEKTVKNSQSLRFHKARHTEQPGFTCELCGKICNTKRNYYRHLRYHKDPDHRKVICSLCGKKVVDLKRHMLTHTGARPYSCTYCEKGFTSPYALKVHTRQHTKEKPYICEYCTDSFAQKVSLQTHLRTKHGLSK